MAIQSFRCKETRSIYEGLSANRFNSIRAVAERKLQMLDDAVELRDLKSPPGNRLEQLAGNRSGQYSIRVNEQWRFALSGALMAPKTLRLWITTKEQ